MLYRVSVLATLYFRVLAKTKVASEMTLAGHFAHASRPNGGCPLGASRGCDPQTFKVEQPDAFGGWKQNGPTPTRNGNNGQFPYAHSCARNARLTPLCLGSAPGINHPFSAPSTQHRKYTRKGASHTCAPTGGSGTLWVRRVYSPRSRRGPHHQPAHWRKSAQSD